MKKAEITAFLSLIFILLVTFTGSVLEAASLEVSKNLRRADAVRAMECIFAEYQKELLEEYDVFEEITDEFEKAVEDKVVAEQQKEAAITKAEQELEVAKLQAQAKIEEARGDAESQKIIASASAEAMAIKIVELAKSLGFTVNETYIKEVRTVVTNKETGLVMSDMIKQEEVSEKPSEGVVTHVDDVTTTITTTTLTNTKYSIAFDADHTKEDLQIILDFVQYLEYLEKWDGELPEVVTGSEGVEIIVPTNPTDPNA